MVMTAQALVADAKKEVREIGLEEGAARLEDGRTVVLDVREPEEYAAGCLKDAISVPRGVLEFRAGSVPALSDPGTPILVYCRSGGRAALAAQTLQRMGYSNVVSLAGGFDAWRTSGRA